MCCGDILCFVETWTLQDDECVVRGYFQLQGARIDSNTQGLRRHSGINIFIKNGIDSVVHISNRVSNTLKNKEVYF